MNRAVLRASAWPAGLAAAGAALVCWGLALGGYWPVAFALYGQRTLPVARAVLALGVMLVAGGGALLATALVASLSVALAPGRSEAGAGEQEEKAPRTHRCSG